LVNKIKLNNMSWEIFKQNILLRANNPGGIPDIDTVAKLYAKEYDAAIKRGFNTLTPPSSVKSGNVETMEQFFKLALQKGLSSTEPYDLVGEMGKGVLAYWGTAILNEFPIPLIPAIGTTANISVTTNIVTNPGIWTPPITAPPSDIDEVEQEMLDAAQDLKDSQENKVLFRSLFETQEDADNHNKPYATLMKELEGDFGEYVSIGGQPRESTVSAELIESVSPNIIIDPETKRIDATKDKTEEKKQPNTSPNKSDSKLFALVGNGQWPATYEKSGKPGSWDVQQTIPGKCIRYMYVVNRAYAKKNLVSIEVPLAGGGVSKETVHVQLYDKLKPCFDKIKAQKLQKYINNCAGSWVVRNVTCGTRLSHHSWALAIDINTDLYAFGQRFIEDDGIYTYNNKTKAYDVLVRKLNDRDKGHRQIAQILMDGGLTWLRRNDPMHFSIYE
jgi:hypothetical protein